MPVDDEKFDPDLLPEMLPLYYKRLFPFGPFYRWLSYGNVDSRDFSNREFSFTLHDDIYVRYQSFNNLNELEDAIKQKNPHKIDIGAVFSFPPNSHRQLSKSMVPTARELVFDIDLTDYDDVRSCCQGADICTKCWRFMSLGCRILDSALREDFGFNHLLWVFSGRRGIHCWVCDAAARALSGPERSAIAEYLQLISGGSSCAKKVNLPNSDKLHSSVRRAADFIKSQFIEVCVKGQDMFQKPESVKQLLSLISEENLRNKIQNGIKSHFSDEEKWQVIVSELSNKNDEGFRKRQWLLEEIIIQYAYPRLDINVTKGLNHLLKSPFCIHPKTGKICVPFSPKSVDKFNPTTVPTIVQLIQEVNDYDADLKKHLTNEEMSRSRVKDYKKTSLNKSIQVFEEFLRKLEDDLKMDVSKKDYGCPARRIDNICSTQHTKTIFLRLGDSGVLTAHNLTHDFSDNGSFHKNCRIEMVTCPSCIISLTFRLINLNCHCDYGTNLFFHNPSRCDYVWVTEPPYENKSGTSFCRIYQDSGSHQKGARYKSKTRTLRISLFYTRIYAEAFTADYKSERNRQVFFGITHRPLKLNCSTGVISSPFFPETYPRDLSAEYVLTCIRQDNFSSQETDAPVEDDSSCRVYLFFTDFQLASSSFVEFFEGSRRVNLVSGLSFRPPVIISATNSLSIHFHASGRSSIGFKAFFSFFSQSVVEKMTRPSTDCGGTIDDFGGTIKMMQMVSSSMKLFDCIWLIRPIKNLFNVKTHLYLKVTKFLDFAGDAELQVREGLTSESPIVEKLRYPVSQNFKEHIIPLNSGYYINLRALFGPESHFAITYATFNQNKCLILSEFLCKNSRCISKKLICDGFDHCGDSSDELGVCSQEWDMDHGKGKWQASTSSYYFPVIKHYSTLKTASAILLVSLVGVIFLISVLTAVLCGIKSKTRRRTVSQDQRQSISDLRDSVSDEVLIEDILTDDPPSYEPPPAYEEAVKIPKSTIYHFPANMAKQWNLPIQQHQMHKQ